MKKSIVTVLAICVLWAPGIIYSQDTMSGEVTRTTSEISGAYFDEFGHLISRDPQPEGASLGYGSSAYFASSNAGSQASLKLSPREWYITEKLPSAKGLAIGVFLFEEGMPIEHIHDVFGKPQETITLDTEEGPYGTILVYPHHHFFFSKTGHLQTIKERKL